MYTYRLVNSSHPLSDNESYLPVKCTTSDATHTPLHMPTMPGDAQSPVTSPGRVLSSPALDVRVRDKMQAMTKYMCDTSPEYSHGILNEESIDRSKTGDELRLEKGLTTHSLTSSVHVTDGTEEEDSPLGSPGRFLSSDAKRFHFEYESVSGYCHGDISDVD